MAARARYEKQKPVFGAMHAIVRGPVHAVRVTKHSMRHKRSPSGAG